MGWLDIFRRAVPKVGELEADKSANIRRMPKKKYICDCVLSFEGNPLRRVKFEVPAYSRSHAEAQIRQEMKITVRKTYKSPRS